MPTNKQKIICVIPARGGSKGIPRKNIRHLAGRPLIAYTIEHARSTPNIDRVFVSTDDEELADVSRKCGAGVIWRPAEISGDTATSESALLHALNYFQESEHYEPSLVVFLQATSPIRRPYDIKNAIETLQREEADSLFSACPLHGFAWRKENGRLSSLSYDYRSRLRRQDAPEDLVENGSIYIFKPWVLRNYGNRLGGKIVAYLMDPLCSFQIDEPKDLKLIESIMVAQNAKRKQKPPDLGGVRLLILDFDGVMTDNRVLVHQEGTEAVCCHRGHGWGIARLKDIGVEVVVLSTEQNSVVSARCRKLGIECIQGSDVKILALKELVQQRSLSQEQVAFVGNDVNDLDCMQWVGFPIAVADSASALHNLACYVTSRAGGHGGVREICDLILFQKKSLDPV
jgi:N-acylneuraminate cytidylyltransferase